MAFVINLPVYLDRAVAVLAAQAGVSKNEIIIMAVEEYLQNNLVVGDDISPDNN